MEASTDLETALHQVEGHDSRVCDTTAQDAPKPAEGVVFRRAELAAIARLCDVGEHRNNTHMLMRHNTTLNMLMKGCIEVRSHTDTHGWLRLTRTHTDLHSALDQVEGHYSRVCGATAEDSSEATEDKVFLWAELTAVSLWGETRSHIHLHKAWDVWLGVSGKPPRWTLKRYLSPAITPSDMSYAKGVLIF